MCYHIINFSFLFFHEEVMAIVMVVAVTPTCTIKGEEMVLYYLKQ